MRHRKRKDEEAEAGPKGGSRRENWLKSGKNNNPIIEGGGEEGPVVFGEKAKFRLSFAAVEKLCRVLVPCRSACAAHATTK